MRGLFGDVIADQVMGYVLCFARNLHTYIRQQVQHRYEPLGGESARVSSLSGPGTVNAMDRATIFLPEATMGIVGFGQIGCAIAERAKAFGMTVRAVDRHPERVSACTDVLSVWGVDRLSDLLAESDFVVIAAPQTPETTGLFNAQDARHDEADGLPDQRRPRRDRRVERSRERPPRRPARRRGPRRLRGRAAAGGSPALGYAQRHHHPHTAGYSPVIAGRHLATLVENVGRFARGDALKNVVDKAAWY